MSTQDIVSKLWNLCNVLRDDGITYHQYVTELTYLLFLKMAKETQTEEQLPAGYRWDDLDSKDGLDQLTFYRELLLYLGSHGSKQVKAIFANASTSLRKATNLKALTDALDALDWYSKSKDDLGDVYEGLLEKNANEVKSGAGQYFTPRPLIDTMVALIKPRAGEIVQDPACGTGGFLIAADRFVKSQTDNHFELNADGEEFQRTQAFVGMELVPDTHRLALMNALLHDIHGPWLQGDTLSNEGKALSAADVILSNPPFGTKKGGGTPTRDDFTFVTSNKQLAFLQHIYRSLKPGGRAAVVLPDNVLFDDNVGVQIRTDLMDKCHLHTILRLPTGIFYAQGVKTNVLFFTRGESEMGSTPGIWVYDMRTNMPSFGKRTPLTREHFKEFEDAYGDDPHGLSPRQDQGEAGRFRYFTREQIMARDENLDLSWLKDESVASSEVLPEPDEIATGIMANLKTALEDLEELTELLSSLNSQKAIPGNLSDISPVKGELPLGWSNVTLGDIGTWFGGGTPSKNNQDFWLDGTIPWVSPKDMKRPRIRTTEDYITEEAVRKSATKLLPTGSVLVVTRSGILSHSLPTAIADVPVSLNQDLKGLVPNGSALPEYVLSALQGYAKEILAECSKAGTTVSSIEFPRFERFQIPLPPLNEQIRIIVKIEELFSIIKRARHALESVGSFINRNATEHKLSMLEQSILAKAFRGELVPQSPNDEPASVMLERLRAQQAEAVVPKAKRGRKPREKAEVTV